MSDGQFETALFIRRSRLGLAWLATLPGVLPPALSGPVSKDHTLICNVKA